MPDPSRSPDLAWSFAPTIVLGLLVYGGLYAWRWRTSRREGGARAAPAARALAFAAALVLAAIALLSPVDALGEQLASFHMVQHLLLADLVPILVMVALTKHLLRPITRVVQRVEEKAGLLAHPAMGVVAYVGVMWLWHVPALYDATLESEVVHALEHTTFLGAGFLYWWHLLSPIRNPKVQRGSLWPIAYMASTKVAVGLLGILLTFSPDVLYDGYAEQGGYWGISVLDDQHVAGAVMAIEQSLVMGVALAYLFIRALTEADAADEREERYSSV